MRSLYYVRKMTVFSKQGATNAIKTRQSRRKPVTQSYRVFEMTASCKKEASVHWWKLPFFGYAGNAQSVFPVAVRR